MEELFVYALLCCEGYDMWAMYSQALDRLFMEAPGDEEYLSMEEMTPKEAVLHSIAVMYRTEFNSEHFGKVLMKSLQQLYQDTALETFAEKAYSLWKKLPETIDKEEPFFTLCYADDCLSYGDEEQCRQLYEKAMHYYDQAAAKSLFID